MTDETDSNSDDDEQNRELVAWLKATLVAILTRSKTAVEQSIDEIAPQVRGALGRLRVPSGAVKPLALATVLIVAAVAFPAAPFAGDTNNSTQEPVTGETYESVGSDDLRQVVADRLRAATTQAPQAPSEVRTSAGSQTMRVETSVVDGDPALVLEDDRTHEGRWVAIDTAWFESEIGEVPQTARIEHESDGTYSTPVEVRGDEATFYVEGFSTNTVTFDGVLSVSASPAVDGDTISYDAPNGGDDLSIDLTGVANTGSVSESGSSTGSTAIDVAGTQEPTGPAGGEPQISVSTPSTVTYSEGWSISGPADYTIPSDWESGSTFVRVTGEGAANTNIDIELFKNGNSVGTKTVETDGIGYANAEWSGISTAPGDTLTASVSSGNDPIFRSVEVTTDYDYDTTIETDTGRSATITGSGSQPIDLTGDETSLTVSHNGDSLESWSLDYNATVETTDPVVEYNGNSVGYTGTLAEGETTSLAVNDSWINEGTNDLSVSLPSVSSGPVPQVGVDVAHDVSESRTIDYSAEAFSERYTTSKTWSENTSNATLTVPWASSSVVSVRDVSVTYEDSTGSEPSPRPTPTHRLENGSVVVELGDVQAGWTTTISATGSKVQVDGADLEVVNATAAGDDLDSRIRLNNPSSDVYLRVGETEQGQQLHYLANASWSNEEASQITAGGENEIRIPNAPDNGEAQLRTLPLAFDVETGAIDVDIPDGRLNEEEPVYRVSAGDSTGDSYDVTFVDAADGQPYILWSETREIVLDEGIASSPLTLSASDSDETQIIQFREDDGAVTSDGGTGPVGAIGPMVTTSSPFSGLTGLLPGPNVFLVGLIGLAGLGVVARQTRLFDDGTATGAVANSAEDVGERAGGLLGRALSNELVLAALTLGGGVWLLTSGAFTPTERLIISIATVPVAMFLVLQQFDSFDIRVWIGSTLLVAGLGIAAIAPEVFETIAEEAGIVIVVVAGYLAYQAISAWRAEASTPDSVTNLEIQTSEDDDGN
ncbi:hypothetical protein [Halorubrum salinum]|uniref:hypothetical protein n=1 Tax=Halorubrum salinum TaxID=767517 RepID=UPI002112019C|nr:hypothetical protein [Halorubrum salinum]